MEKTVLGFDAFLDGKLVATDLNEKDMLALLAEGKRARLVISIIGAQGSVLGRGTQQVSPHVIRKIGIENIIVVATPHKLSETPVLFLDTGDRGVGRGLWIAPFRDIRVSCCPEETAWWTGDRITCRLFSVLLLMIFPGKPGLPVYQFYRLLRDLLSGSAFLSTGRNPHRMSTWGDCDRNPGEGCVLPDHRKVAERAPHDYTIKYKYIQRCIK